MPDYSTPDYQRRAARKYLSKFKEIKLRTLPEEHEAITAHAKAAGDKSTVAFIMRAIEETMERDKQKMQSKDK